CWRAWTPPRRPTAWPCLPVLSVTPVSAGSRSAGAWAGQPPQPGLAATNSSTPRGAPPTGQTARPPPSRTPARSWAIRGGGGNFGVVTEFDFRLHEVGPVAQVGLLFWDLEQGRDVLGVAREIIAALPRDLNIIIAGLNAPAAPFVPVQHHHQPGYVLVVAGFGSAAGHAQVMTRIRRALPPLWEFATPMPYVALQQLLDEANAWGFHTYDRGAYLEDLSDKTIEVVTDHLPRKNSPLSALLLYRLDQAYSQVGEDDTAFSGGRSPRYAVFIVAV